MTSDRVNEYMVLDKETLESCLRDLGNLLDKRIKKDGINCELIIVGGASVILNYGFRYSTSDIDCTDAQKVLMNDLINVVAEKYNLPHNWINTSFTDTKSYSPKIYQYSSFYKSYGNGKLIIRTIKDEYLLAMKIASGRKYKNDYSDIFGIITSCIKEKHVITKDMLEKAIVDLYGSLDDIDEEIFIFTKKVIDNPSRFNYEDIRKSEDLNK